MSNKQQLPEEQLFNQVKKLAPNNVKQEEQVIQRGIINSKLQHSDWVVDSEWAKIQQRPIRAKALLYLVATGLILLTLWAAYAPLDEITRGVGKVIPSNKLQVVQSLDGGVIKNILIHEGDAVTKNQLLIQIDSTRSKSSLNENLTQTLALKAEVTRLQALTNNSKLDFSKAFSNDLFTLAAPYVNREKQLYQSHKEAFQQKQNILASQKFQKEQDLQEALAMQKQYQKNIRLLTKELNAVKPLLTTGAVSEVEVFKLTRELNSLKGGLAKTQSIIKRNEGAIVEANNKIDELLASTMSHWREQLSESSAKLAALSEVMVGLQDRVKQTDIRSPINGFIQRLLANTVSGVVSPGETLLEIIPINDELIVETKILPKDIAFIRIGQQAMIKFSAYDFAIYGGVEAEVTHISPDSITDENKDTYYIVKLKTDMSHVHNSIEVIPGMTTQTDIITGKNTVLEYLFKPILRASSEAMTER